MYILNVCNSTACTMRNYNASEPIATVGKQKKFSEYLSV